MVIRKHVMVEMSQILEGHRVHHPVITRFIESDLLEFRLHRQLSLQRLLHFLLVLVSRPLILGGGLLIRGRAAVTHYLT